MNTKCQFYVSCDRVSTLLIIKRIITNLKLVSKRIKCLLVQICKKKKKPTISMGLLNLSHDCIYKQNGCISNSTLYSKQHMNYFKAFFAKVHLWSACIFNLYMHHWAAHYNDIVRKNSVNHIPSAVNRSNTHVNFQTDM